MDPFRRTSTQEGITHPDTKRLKQYVKSDDQFKDLYRRNYRLLDFKNAEEVLLDENAIIDLRDKRFRGIDNVIFSWEILLDSLDAVKSYDSDKPVSFWDNMYEKFDERNITESREQRERKILNLIEPLGGSVDIESSLEEGEARPVRSEDMKLAGYAGQNNALLMSRDNDFIRQNPNLSEHLGSQTPEDFFGITVAPPPVVYTGFQMLNEGTNREYIDFGDVINYSQDHAYLINHD